MFLNKSINQSINDKDQLSGPVWQSLNDLLGKIKFVGDFYWALDNNSDCCCRTGQAKKKKRKEMSVQILYWNKIIHYIVSPLKNTEKFDFVNITPVLCHGNCSSQRTTILCYMYTHSCFTITHHLLSG